MPFDMRSDAELSRDQRHGQGGLVMTLNGVSAEAADMKRNAMHATTLVRELAQSDFYKEMRALQTSIIN